jgi:hypothetical protein
MSDDHIIVVIPPYQYPDNWEAEWHDDSIRCKHCGTHVTATTTDGLRRIKAEHRQTCPQPSSQPHNNT